MQRETSGPVAGGGPGPWIALSSLIALAVAMRLWGIRWGLPDSTHLFSYHPDEFHSLRGALALAAGDPNPHFFNYGTLYLYLVALVCLWHDAVFGGADLLNALLRSTAPHREMAMWVLDARLVTVALGSATVAVAFVAGHRLGGLRAAAIAGAVMALLPLHVLHSHYATVDVAQAFFIALCLAQALVLAERPTRRGYLLAGVWAGLAASVKYNGAVVLVAPALAWWLGRSRGNGAPEGPVPGLSALAGMVGAAALAFALTSPYVILSWPEAWRDIRFELQHMRVGESPVREAYPNGWLFHAHASLAVGALALVAARGDRRRRILPLVGFALVWWALIGAAGVRYARYELPLEPVTAILSGAAWTWAYGLRGERWWRGAWALLGALYMALIAGTAVYHCRALSTENVRDVMLREIVARVPEGERLAVIWEPWFNVAPIDYCNGGEVLRRNPLFARFRRPALAQPPVVIGMDVGILQRERPYAVLVSDFELDPAFNAVSPAHRQMSDALWKSGVYESVLHLGRPRAPFEPRHAWRASDNRYAVPQLTLFVRRK